jgi:CheY-like chemotaxis protein
VANSGAEALEKIVARSKPYQAVLMDVQMQDMDGYETTRRVRALEQNKGFRHYIIGVTAHALAGDREKCLAAGMDDYMSKPINPDLLQQKLMQQSAEAA